jgi:subtilisin family serine protease
MLSIAALVQGSTRRYMMVLKTQANLTLESPELSAPHKVIEIGPHFKMLLGAFTQETLESWDPWMAHVVPDRRQRSFRRALPRLATDPHWAVKQLAYRHPPRPTDRYVTPKGRKGRNVVAYVVDCALDARHPLLQNRVLATVDLCSTCPLPPPPQPNELTHATQVAALLAGQYGVAPQMSLVGYRVAEEHEGYSFPSDLIQALAHIVVHAKSHARPAVVNLSLGYEPNEVVDLAVKAVIAEGIPVVAAAGNDAMDACKSSPGRVPEVITVASSNQSNQASRFTNWGPCVDVFAPGEQLVVFPSKQKIDGTSFSTPLVSGVVALLQEAQGMRKSVAQLKSNLLALATVDRIQIKSPNTTRSFVYNGGEKGFPPII